MSALLTYKGELKANEKICDFDGTPNPNGLYSQQLTTKYKLVEAYKLQPLNTALFNVTSVNDVIPLVVLISDLPSNDKDQLFATKDENGTLIKLGFYVAPVVEPCLTEVENFFSNN